MDSSGFLTAWFLDFQGQQPKRVRGMVLSRPSLKSHLASILVSSNVQDSHYAQPTFKGKEIHLIFHSGSAKF